MAHVFRFFLPAGSAVGVGDVVVLTAADAKRVHRVLRLGVGEPVEVADPSGRVFAASVADPKAGLVALDAELPRQPDLAPLRVLLAQSGARADDAVEKLVELGVAEIGPLGASGRRQQEERTDRWERIAAAAAAQAKLPRIPTILAGIAFREALVPGAIVCSHQGPDAPLEAALAAASTAGAGVSLLVGPEAGFTDAELAEARAVGVPIVAFGWTVLRTETAAIVAAACVRERLQRG